MGGGETHPPLKNVGGDIINQSFSQTPLSPLSFIAGVNTVNNHLRELFDINWLVALMLSGVWLFAALWTVARQASLSMEFPRQEYWSGLPFSTREDVLDPGIERVPGSPESLALVGEVFTTSITWEAPLTIRAPGNRARCSQFINGLLRPRKWQWYAQGHPANWPRLCLQGQRSFPIAGPLTFQEVFHFLRAHCFLLNHTWGVWPKRASEISQSWLISNQGENLRTPFLLVTTG